MAITWTEREWKICPPAVIKNCFTYCFKQNGQDSLENAGYNQKETLQSMARDAREHCVEVSKDNLAHFFDPCSKDDVTETVCLNDLAREVANISDGEQENKEQTDENAEKKLPNFVLHLDASTHAYSILDSYGHLS